jgi:GxxExxY protein
MTENEISYKIRGAIFKIYNNLGPGLFESVCEKALIHELTKDGLNVEYQVAVPFVYDTIKMDLGFRMDLVVEGRVVVEIKSVEALNEIFRKQLLTYLVLSNKKLGLLVNFNTTEIDKSIIRIVNGL